MPLFKKRDLQLYRLIYYLKAAFGMVIERIVFKQIYIYNHLHCDELINPLQPGFIPGHSTIFQLHLII
jgi:hypothetical protein